MTSANPTTRRYASSVRGDLLLVPKLHLGTQLSAQLRCCSRKPKASRNPVQWLSQLLPLVLLIALSSSVRADDLTGMPYDDPKELSPVPAPSASSQASASSGFLPMPGWARGNVMPPLPAELKPMGGKTPVAGPAKVAAAPLAPPKDVTPPTTTTEQTSAAPKAPTPAETPAMITVSPFLQWIKSNPQAAAAQARQEANAYNNPSASGPNAPDAAHPPAVINGQNASSSDPYWLPPLIDSPEIMTTGVVGGSSAIYSTPQR